MLKVHLQNANSKRLTGKQKTKRKLYNTLSFLNQQCLGEHFSWLKNSVGFPFLKPKSTLFNIKTFVLLNSFCKLQGEIRQKIEFFSFYKTLLSKNENRFIRYRFYQLAKATQILKSGHSPQKLTE
jgi:hypothetical protein